jgi:uncharacterized repeat protein (TIGR03803 family)
MPLTSIYPSSGVIIDSVGNLYGTTSAGTSGAGTVYKVDPGGNETVLHSFTAGADGIWPAGGVVRDAAGNLYGAMQYGGRDDVGMVFMLRNAPPE